MGKGSQAPPIFLRAKDIAARWHVSRQFIYQLKDRGELPCYFFGGSVRFRLEDIEAYEAAAKYQGRAEPDMRVITQQG